MNDKTALEVGDEYADPNGRGIMVYAGDNKADAYRVNGQVRTLVKAGIPVPPAVATKWLHAINNPGCGTRTSATL